MPDLLGTLEIRSEVSQLEKVFAFVDQHCSRREIPDSIRYKVLLIAEELTMNAMSHGYRGRLDGWIAISLYRDSDGIEVRFEDEAPPFDPLHEGPEPRVDAGVAERPIGGLGIHLVKALSRMVKYERLGERNVVRVVFSTAIVPGDDAPVTLP
jgi:anti-sigma regulatory factor (Ser/Thr protein kinase)